MRIKTAVKKHIVLLFVLLSFLFVTSCVSQGVTSVKQENTKEEKDGTFEVDITFEGGTGKAYIKSPVTIERKDGQMSATFVWSSKNYDYMLVDNVRYDNENPGGESTFTIPVKTLDEPLNVIGDTTAMSKPHEIEYTIYWESDNTEEETYPDAVNERPLFSSDTLSGIKKSGEIKLKYATCFNVTQFGEYKVISIKNSGDYLIVPDGMDVPKDLPKDMTVLKQPIEKTYLVSTSVMDFVCRLDALDHIALSGTQADDWSIEEARKAMMDGKILYAGKYRAPDYELILSKGCDLAIENTMIYHEPEAKEKLEELGIPVLVETSSYEKHPLARLEWIKLYGILFGREEEADRYFEDQCARMESVMESADTDKSVAFFYVTTSGLINVRKPGDYVSTMIDLAGGRYVIDDDSIKADNSLSTMNMQMEDFYACAKDADIIIYNSTIAGEIASVDELVSKNAMFADFKAVKEGRVYCTDRDLFQQVAGMAEFMNDLNLVFNGQENDLCYLKKLD